MSLQDTLLRTSRRRRSVRKYILSLHQTVAMSRPYRREVSGVMCDKKMPIKLKDKIYKTIVKPAMIYGSECWAVKKNDTQKLHTTEMRMLRWARGKTKKDHVKNEDIWREDNVEPMTTFLRKKRLRWYGHVLRKEGMIPPRRC